MNRCCQVAGYFRMAEFYSLCHVMSVKIYLKNDLTFVQPDLYNVVSVN